MLPNPIEVLLLSFNPVVGWRVATRSKSRFPKLGIVKIGAIKLLRMPMFNEAIPGRFCNPRKLLGV